MLFFRENTSKVLCFVFLPVICIDAIPHKESLASSVQQESISMIEAATCNIKLSHPNTFFAFKSVQAKLFLRLCGTRSLKNGFISNDDTSNCGDMNLALTLS